MTEDEYQRERNRLKQVRYRKRNKAIAEGLEPDFYITDADYIDVENLSTTEPATLAHSPVTRRPVASEQEESEQESNGFMWGLAGVGALFLGLIGYAWYTTR